MHTQRQQKQTHTHTRTNTKQIHIYSKNTPAHNNTPNAWKVIYPEDGKYDPTWSVRKALSSSAGIVGCYDARMDATMAAIISSTLLCNSNDQ